MYMAMIPWAKALVLHGYAAPLDQISRDEQFAYQFIFTRLLQA